MLKPLARPDSIGSIGLVERPRHIPDVPSPDALQVIHWIFRVAVAAEFIGHGAFGIITKAAWVPYFGVVGIPEWLAWRLMPVVGGVDIALGILALFRPMPVVLLYMACWGFWTALLRPLSGEGIWEFLERAGNFGITLAFLYVGRPVRRPRDWFSAIHVRPVPPGQVARLAWILRLTTAALLIGHGGFGAFMQKAAWTEYFGAVAITPQMVDAGALIPGIGWFEIALGLLVLAWPAPGVLIAVFVWKVGTELLRPVVGEPVWEFIERAGSYAAPLALLYVRRWTVDSAHGTARPALAHDYPDSPPGVVHPHREDEVSSS